MAYNGHKNWNAWNVALWIGNDEGLYNLAREAKRRTKNAAEAADYFINAMNEVGNKATPDGAPYNRTNVKAAMSGL